MSARVRFTAALVVLATFGALATAPARASAPPSSTPLSNVPLYPLDEFVGRWNEANDLVAEQMSPAVHVPIDPAALVLRPIDEDWSFFDWHITGTGYVGGLVHTASGAVYVAVTAGDPENPAMRSMAGTLLFMLTSDRPDDTATLSQAYLDFASSAQPGSSDYVVAGPLGLALLAFDGLEPNAPWVAVSAAAPADEDLAISEAEMLSTQIASTAVPPAPAPATTEPGSSVPAAGLASPTAEAPTTTVPLPTTTAPPPTTVLPGATSVFPSIDAFAEAWNETTVQMALIDPAVEVFHFDPAAVVRGPLPPDTNLGEVESFAVPIATNGFVGGLVDPVSGAVTSVTVGGDPDAQIVRSSAGVLLLSTLDISVAAQAVEAWAALAADTSQVKLDYVVAGPLGVMLQVIEGAEAGDNLVSVVIAPATTEEEAFIDSYLTFVAVFGLALDAPPPPPTTTPAAPLLATTTPIAPLPSIPPSTVTATTGLPSISLAPPTPTTLVAPSGNQIASE